ncbi:uncharacterized protein PgNI_02181 [Pyricularia grisea]|uniref:Metallo-beta-lactamase domain-containing protein n=1 Tax=Pyricularia grisea TaxID=148305 RepID=A0A6P8BG55_PYRGI|nr:uncharacterized protein PgNI_02181 [Pyricularia grisea]TLD15614.1 hypothetical protein PgNI_02181 [Pyricularia grisea]
MTAETLIKPVIHDIFEPVTGTWQYIVADPHTKAAIIIDSVLDVDPASCTLSTTSAEKLLAVVRDKGYKVERILETHIHADHVTAASYLKKRIAGPDSTAPKVCIGRRVEQVQERFGARYGVPDEELRAAFDHLYDDDEEFTVGSLSAKAIHLPGHTPDHLGYIIGSNVFCGDTIFNPDVGSARCDFPGGDATALYSSVQRLLGLPADYRIWVGHDYPPGGDAQRSEPLPSVTVAEQTSTNKHLGGGVGQEDFVAWRTARDSQLGEPRLMHYALQMNIRGGSLPRPSGSGDRMVHVPLKLNSSVGDF